MKDGHKTSEFWFALLTVIGLYALIWFGKYPDHGSAAETGIEFMLAILAGYTGSRTYVKGKLTQDSKEETPNPTPNETKTPVPVAGP